MSSSATLKGIMLRYPTAWRRNFPLRHTMSTGKLKNMTYKIANFGGEKPPNKNTEVRIPTVLGPAMYEFAWFAMCLTHWPLGDLNAILKMQFSILFYWLVSSDLLMIIPPDECHRTLLMISQGWFRQCLGTVRQHAITWASVDPVPCHLMASLCHNELICIEQF